MTASLPTYTAVNGHTNGYDYPPRASSTGSSTKALLSRLSSAGVSPPTRVRRLLLFVAVLALSSTLLVYIVFSDALSASTFSFAVPQHEYAYTDDYAEGNDPRSPFFRDAHPALHARLFLARAQAEIRARGLDTCGGQLSAPMVDAYLTAAVPYCVPADSAADNSSSITCFPARAGPGTPNAWWPYPQAFCASRNLAHTEGWARSGEFTGACVVSEGGKRLKGDMGTEGFLGAEFREGDAEGKDQQCGETIKHPVLFVPRQDRWNPFHVGEDLVTTFLALTLFSRHVAPSSSASNNLWTTLPSSLLSSSPSAAIAELQKELAPAAHLQLIFQDDHLPTASLFAPLYDRIGAWTPRRTAADALGMGAPTCFTTAFHSVGAGASLLSATRVAAEYTCASELVWGASLWLRWVWGMEGLPGAGASVAAYKRGEGGSAYERGGEEREDEREGKANEKREWAPHAEPVQVIFLSREKFDAFTRHKDAKLTGWQEARHIANEGALVAGLRAGLAGACRVRTAVGTGSDANHKPAAGAHECTYTDADALPDAWGVALHPREARALGVRRVAKAGAGAVYANRTTARKDDDATTHTDDDSITQADRRSISAPRALRFATLDPTTSALAAQLGAVGRADVVVSVHAGALGLTLFMPPGRASVVELVTKGAKGNHHFHNMAHMLGMQYVRVDVAKTVDVPAVVRAVLGVVEARLAA